MPITAEKFLVKVLIGLSVFAILISCGDKELKLNGDVCFNADSCESGKCLTEYKNGAEVAGGLCTESCDYLLPEGPEPDYDTCADEQHCLTYLATDEKHCYQACSSVDDCRTSEGWICICVDIFCTRAACVPPV